MKFVGYQIFFTDYQIRHLSNPSGLPEIFLRSTPATVYVHEFNTENIKSSIVGAPVTLVYHPSYTVNVTLKWP